MKSNRLLAFVIVSVGLLLAACNPQPPDEIPADQDIPQVSCKGNLPAPSPVSPTEFEVVNSQEPTTFEWTFPGSCAPQGYRFQLWTVGDYTEPANYLLDQVVYGTKVTFYDIPLKSARTYEWQVAAIPVVFPNNFKPNFNTPAQFITAPLCNANELAAPTLVFPENNSVVTSLNNAGLKNNVYLNIELNPAKCIPEYNEYYVSTTSYFSGFNYHLNPETPYWSPTLDGKGLSQTLVAGWTDKGLTELPDCSKIYWRARVGQGTTQGPFSETHSFFTDFGPIQCAVPLQYKDVPYVKGLQDANCRMGPSSQFDNVGTLFEDQEAEVLAVNTMQTYVKIQEPNSEDLACWVWLDLVDLMVGDEIIDPEQLLDLVAVENPPTPTVEPTATFTPEPYVPQCSDGIDNDGDGLIDMADGRCTSPNDNSESS